MKLVEVENNSAAFVFGRFNPPTLGHKKLFDQLKTVSDVRFVFVSHTQDKKKNPLSWNQKVSIMSAQFPEMADYVISDPNIKTIIDVMKFLETAGHKSVIMVAGSDRVKSFEELLNKYNGKEYNFDSIRVHSAGLRDPDADSLEGVSASKAREAAVQGDFDGFATMFAGTDGLKKQIYDAVRKGMGVREGLSDYMDKVDTSEAKIKLSKDPMNFGAMGLEKYKARGPVINISTKDLVGFEPEDKMRDPKSMAKVNAIAKAVKDKQPIKPVLVRKYQNGYQIIDGHHRFWGQRKAGASSIKAQVIPDSDIEEEAAGVGIVTKQNTTKDVNKKTLGKIMKALHLK